MTIFVLWASLFLTSLIPNESIRYNLIAACETIGHSEPFEHGESGRIYDITDNYADIVLLSVMWSVSSDDAFISSLDTDYYDGEDYGENYGLYTSVTEGAEPNADYTRYWHGMMVLLRPLFALTTAENAKLVLFCLVMVLAAVGTFFLFRRRQFFAGGVYLLSFIAFHAWNIRLSFEYIPAFLVMTAIVIPFILLESKGDSYLITLSVVSGTCIGFFDFLTAETLTITVPLLLVFIMREQDKRLGNFRDTFRLTAGCGISWGAAYIMTFITKWTLASVVTGENKFVAALSSVGERTGGTVNDGAMSLPQQILSAPLANISTLFGGKERVATSAVVAGIVITLLVFGGVYLIFCTNTKRRDIAKIALIIALVPYLRYIVLSNHSYMHEYFTYRAQMATFIGLSAAVWFNVSFMKSKPVKKKKAVK